MYRKIICILVCIMLVATMVTVHEDLNVEGASGGDGEGDNGGIELPYDFVWNTTYDLTRVVYDAYDQGDIPKGRAWATAGEYYTINNTLLPEMNKTLDGVQKLQLKYNPNYPSWEYSSKVVTNDFQLTINNNGYPLPNDVPKNESFPFPTGYKDWRPFGQMTCNYTFDQEIIELKNMTDRWPFGGSFTNEFLNVSCSAATDFNVVIGNVSYIASDEDVPEYTEGEIFIINEEQGSQDKVDNMTNASGCILIYDYVLGENYVNTSKCNFSVVRIANDAGNLTNITSLLENGTRMIVDNVVDGQTLTFTYNLSGATCIPDEDWVYLDRIPTPYELYNKSAYAYGVWHEHLTISTYFSCVWQKAQYMRAYNRVNLVLPDCIGFILYDSYETHMMFPTTRNWFHPSRGLGWGNAPALPTFSINYTVGDWLHDNLDGTTISGYLDQEWHWQNPLGSGVGVETYNVVGYRNTTCSPNNSVIIINNRFDGWWGETPGDSGIGGAIVLGIAKYFNDNNIEPKYNLTFLMTTGEEYGYRGGFHYRDTHIDDNVIAFFA